MKGSLIIILIFCMGIFSGYYGLDLTISSLDPGTFVLYILMFLVGIGAGSDTKTWEIIRKMNIKIVFVPASIIAGTLSGTFICSLFLSQLNISDALAIGSGFGYYSLSSIIITKFRSETIGVIALVANITREIITLIATPLLIKYFGSLAPIASGAATSMDTTLPIIVKYSGKDYAVISVFNGVVLTTLVPFIITFIYSL